MKIATWNVNGIRARQGQVLDWLAAEQPDIVCLQELKAHIDQLPFELRDLEHYYAGWHGDKGYSGVGLLVKRSIVTTPPVFTHPPFDFERRVISAELDFGRGPVLTSSFYVPNGGKDYDAKIRFLTDMDAWAAAHMAAGQAILFCGDLNVAHTELDLANPKPNRGKKGFTDEERAGFQAFLEAGFLDTFRLFTSGNGHYTWWSLASGARARNVGWRIDYVLVSAALRRRVKAAAIHADVLGSDHCPVSITLTG